MQNQAQHLLYMNYVYFMTSFEFKSINEICLNQVELDFFDFNQGFFVTSHY